MNLINLFKNFCNCPLSYAAKEGGALLFGYITLEY